MPKGTKKKDDKQKLQQIMELLKFVLTLDDEEIVKSTIESVIELLEEEISK
jgi:Trp operon repressor